MNRPLALLSLCLSVSLSGCSNWNVLARSQSPDEEQQATATARLVGDMAVPFGQYPVPIESVGLVTGLKNTGSDPTPGPQRAVLLSEMQARGVAFPNAVLASRDTAMVMVRGCLRPGIQKGDTFDVEVRVPGRSETTSLRDGHLLQTRLREMRVMDGSVHEGHVLGLAEGAILIDPSADGKEDKVMLGRGRILGGGVCQKSRSLGLVLKPEHQNVLNSSRIANAVNKRFHLMQKGIKIGVATAKTDEFIELAVHPRYHDNIERYMQVVRAIAVRESTSEATERVNLLEKQLAEPITAAHAALQLEGLGHEGIEPLVRAIKSKDPEVRFYAAEALAYLDRREAAEPLGQLARQEPAFRALALAALGAMNDGAAYDQLRELLGVASVETRYGAFRALWSMNSNDPLVLGEQLGGQFSYHVLDTQGPPMVHVARSKRAEIVLFGHQQRLKAPFYLEAGGRIIVRNSKENPDEVVLSRFAVGESDQQRVVSTQLDDVIRAVVDLGGTYPDAVQALAQAKACGALESRFEVDAVPETGRLFDRAPRDEPEVDPEQAKPGGWFGFNPLARLFPKWGGDDQDQSVGSDKHVDEEASDSADSVKKASPAESSSATMVGSASD